MNGFRRIQSHFSLPKPVKLYAFPLELVLDASKTIFSVGRSVKLSRFIYRKGFGRIQSLFFSLQKPVKLYAFPLELVLDASKTILFRSKISQIVSIC